MFKKEDYAIVLDFLPHGKAGEAKHEPVAQAMGESYFTILELIIKPATPVSMGERIYIGRDQRDKVDHIRGRINYQDLTTAAQNELERNVRTSVSAREKDFVDFVNRAGSINIRSHTLEHLPSIGKKHLQTILDERTKKPFESFQDLQQRVPHLGNPLEIFSQRIIAELKGTEKYYLFVKRPAEERRW